MTKINRYCLALDLQDDPKLISEYIEYHKPEHAWPQITTNMKELGILDMEIYHLGDRLVMIMETTDEFDPNEPPRTEQGRKESEEWEELMWKYQKPLKWAKNGEKWVRMEKIYDLKEALD
ncbi:L-rhamnose mutarotase [Paraglaciecola aquimarina]|uniref:L-rhamnose mutarotase n=1 Tax=Paraglaciecola aquimarina TaxID=1235557 RepID=A0ABU3SYQ5_9ALTE|nr:L-rhamnose mutarotase [Paraglaciecola aquimarina]MDU0355130.1 L-rhamnose mutarotase [Paraglaciecola aquimarina]